MEKKKKELLFAGFNQDNQCFSVGTNDGFRIYNTEPFKMKFERILEGEIAMVIMLYRTNILALVGSDNNMNHKRSKLIIWDDNQKKSLSELKFNQNIMNVKLRKDKIIVVCRDKIYIFNLSTFKNMDIIETGDNSHGIVGVSFDPNQTILAYPDKTKGCVRIKNFEKASVFSVQAHENNIAYICISYDGNLMATASEQGTLIRIFQTETGAQLQELRRGKDKADIKHICFSPDYKFLAASSNKGTIHIWSLTETFKKLNKSMENEIENKTSGFKWLPSFLGGNFFSSEWSFAQVRITDHRSICCFGSENSVIIVSTNGKYYKAQIDMEKGGECKIVEEEQLL
jgi:WD40 repeat protein